MSGESATHALGRHFGWSDRILFTAMLGFWWFFLIVTITLLMVVIRRLQALSQEREAAGEILPPSTTPMEPGALAAVVAGI